ncbi:MAG TPA: IclR family transcriptional regulator [Thermoleophilia bacterium]|nr:IclR family transcriptional regulator [Thermoleophilia bacterium]
MADPAFEPADERDPLLVRALTRGLSILHLFDVDNREWTVDQMAEQTGLLRMTTYRMVRTLESASFLVRDPATNRYHLGPAVIAMTYVSDDHFEFVTVARPFLDALVERTGESVTLAIEVDGAPVCVDIVNTTRPFKRQTARGRIIGDVASVHGKIFAAFKSDEEQEEILARPHPRFTPNTVTDPQALAEEFDQVARDGVAFDVEGLYVSTCAVGAPVRDQMGEVVAAISVVMPTGRFGPEERRLCAQEVKTIAASLSAYLGWKPGEASPGGIP